MVPYYKSKIERYKHMACPVCNGVFTIFYKNPKELEEIVCPACSFDSNIDNEDDDD